MKKTNLELKHRCSDFKSVRGVLKEMGARKERVIKQKDYFFHLSEEKRERLARLKLRIEGKEQALIYYERPDFRKGKSTTSKVVLYEVRDSALLPFLIKCSRIEYCR